MPSLLALPLELSLAAAGCSVCCLADRADAAIARTELQRADVLLIGTRRPDIVAARWVKSGCVLLDLGLASCSAPTPTMPMPLQPARAVGAAADAADAAGASEPPPDESCEQRDVLCLCCSDGLASMAATLRMRNASHAALIQQGFIEPHEGIECSKSHSPAQHYPYAPHPPHPSHQPHPPQTTAPASAPHSHPPLPLPTEADECCVMDLDSLTGVLTSV